MTVHIEYTCKCVVPVPLIYHGEDSGLCTACNGVYDERLYETRLRQHVKDFTYDSVHDYLMATIPHYRALVA